MKLIVIYILEFILAGALFCFGYWWGYDNGSDDGWSRCFASITHKTRYGIGADPNQAEKDQIMADWFQFLHEREQS